MIRTRRFLRLERGILSYRPKSAGSQPKPALADQVLDALAVVYKPGDRVGIREIRQVAGIGRDPATSIRRWARSNGCWPYQDGLAGFGCSLRRPANGGIR